MARRRPAVRRAGFRECHALLAKGGVHEKSRGAKRAAQKLRTRREAGEWCRHSPDPCAQVTAVA